MSPVVTVRMLKRWKSNNAGEVAGFDSTTAERLIANGYADPLDGPGQRNPDRQLVDPVVEVLNDDDEAKEKRDREWYEKAPDGPSAHKMVASAPRKGRR